MTRRNHLNRGTTPLLWATPPSTLIQRIYEESQAAVRWFGIGTVLGRQPWLRKVQRLAAAGIYVEEK